MSYAIENIKKYERRKVIENLKDVAYMGAEALAITLLFAEILVAMIIL